AYRVVQPDIGAGDQVAGQVDVIVRQEQEAVTHTGLVCELDDLLHELLATHVVRVGLAGDHELHRAFLVEEDGTQPLRVAQHQCQALVGGHTAGETDGQHLRVQD